MKIPVGKIIPNPEQPRKEFDPGGLQTLAESIQQHGLINPISVMEAGDQYILIDGERRWRAAQLAGLEEIEASVRPNANGTGSQERLVLALVANIQRKDMNPVEEGHAFMRLREMGYSTFQIGKMVGLANSNVLNRLHLLDLDPEIQELFAARRLPLHFQVITAIKSLPDESRVRITRSLAQNNASIKTILQVASKLKTETTKRYAWEEAKSNTDWSMVCLISKPVPAAYHAAARETCQKCLLFEHASQNTCRDCPAVDLLKRIIQG